MAWWAIAVALATIAPGTATAQVATVTSVESVRAPSGELAGEVAVRLSIQGGAQDAWARVSAAGPADGRSAFTARGGTAWLSQVTPLAPDLRIGGGELSHGAALPTPCLRGGYAWLTSGRRVWHTVRVPAGASGDLVLTVGTALGLAQAPRTLSVSAGPWYPTTTAQPPFGGAPDPSSASAPAMAVTLELPVTAALPRDAVSLSLQSTNATRTRVRGQLLPARAGAKVAIVGRQQRRLTGQVEGDILSDERYALGALNAGVKRLAVVRTRADGRFAAWVDGRPGTVFAARTEGQTGLTQAGSSCPLRRPAPAR